MGGAEQAGQSLNFVFGGYLYLFKKKGRIQYLSRGLQEVCDEN
jgi:hypothetical protein